MNTQAIAALLEPVLAGHGLELDDLDISRAGSRSVLRVTVDGDGPQGRGPLLDDIAAATRDISDVLDASPLTGDHPYVLEVSSRGTSRPLTRPAHWRRNRGRLVLVTPVEGERVTGRIHACDDEGVTLSVEGADVAFAFGDIRKAVVQVEMNRPTDPEIDDPAVWEQED